MVGEPVHPVHRLGAGVASGAPHDAPARVVEQEREGVGDPGRHGLLLPVGYLEARHGAHHDGDEQTRAQRLGGELLCILAVESARLDERGPEALASRAAQLDQPPRAQR